MLDLIDPLRPRRHRVAVGRQTGGDEAGRMTDGSGGVPHVLADSQGSAVHLPHPFEITYAYETYDIQPPTWASGEISLLPTINSEAGSGGSRARPCAGAVPPLGGLIRLDTHTQHSPNTG
jgi:hypothetical protein